MRLAEQVAEWVAGLRAGQTVAPRLPADQASVASWLRGDERRLKTLTDLLHGRVEGRGLLPTPSNPYEVMVNAGRDAEARELARLLLLLCTSPVQLGNEGSNDNRELSG